MKISDVYTDELRAFYDEYWDVDLENGIVTWKKARKGIKVGSQVGRLKKQLHTSYRQLSITLDGKTKMYRLHRILVALREGREISELQVDHIDGNGLNNRSDNLRLATNQENQKNRKLSPRNTSGYPGVSEEKRTGKWTARIKIDGKVRHLGTYEEKWQAITRRKLAEIAAGFHANHGRRGEIKTKHKLSN